MCRLRKKKNSDRLCLYIFHDIFHYFLYRIFLIIELDYQFGRRKISSIIKSAIAQEIKISWNKIFQNVEELHPSKHSEHQGDTQTPFNHVRRLQKQTFSAQTQQQVHQRSLTI